MYMMSYNSFKKIPEFNSLVTKSFISVSKEIDHAFEFKLFLDENFQIIMKHSEDKIIFSLLYMIY